MYIWHFVTYTALWCHKARQNKPEVAKISLSQRWYSDMKLVTGISHNICDSVLGPRSRSHSLKINSQDNVRILRVHTNNASHASSQGISVLQKILLGKVDYSGTTVSSA